MLFERTWRMSVWYLLNLLKAFVCRYSADKLPMLSVIVWMIQRWSFKGILHLAGFEQAQPSTRMMERFDGFWDPSCMLSMEGVP